MDFSHFIWPAGWLRLPPMVAILSIFALLGLFQLIAILLKSSKQPNDWLDFQKRVETWWSILAPLAGALLLGPYAFCLLWAAIAALGVRELLNAHPLAQQDRPLGYYLYAAPFLHTLALCVGVPPLYSITPLLLAYPIYMLLRGTTEAFLERSAWIQWILVQMTLLIGFVPLLALVAPGHDPQVGRAALPIWVLFTTQFNDALQYCCGKLLGKTQPHRRFCWALAHSIESARELYHLAPYLHQRLFWRRSSFCCEERIWH